MSGAASTRTDSFIKRAGARRGRAILSALVAALLITRAPPVVADDASPSAAEAKREADARYREARALYERGDWNGALGAFAAARQLRPTWASTAGVAFCLAKLKRFDEALETFEAVLREFGGELSPQVKATAQDQIDEIRRHVGALDVQGAEPGAVITVDGRGRGHYPLPGPLRLTEGTHVVLVTLQGFEPYATSVDIAADRIARVDARLRPLRKSGLLRVNEKEGRALDVVVDGSVLGQTPWEGLLAPGEHMIALRGEGDLGTPPLRVAIEVDKTALLTLVAEELTAVLRVEPVPVNASVAVDGITIGRGLWEGRLRPGEHRIEVAAPGFRSESQAIVLGDRQRKVVGLSLERDASSPFFRARGRPGRFLVDATTSLALVPGFSCDDSCGTTLRIDGGLATLHAGYELGMGLGFGVTAGYLGVQLSYTNTKSIVLPVGHDHISPDSLLLDKVDRLTRLRGGLMGAWLGYTWGERAFVHLRLGAGALVGSVLHEIMKGSLPQGIGGPISVGPLMQLHPFTYVYLTPEARVGLSLGPHAAIFAGIAVPAFLPTGQAPMWDGSHYFGIGSLGIGTIPTFELMPPAWVAIVPGIGARYEF